MFMSMSRARFPILRHVAQRPFSSTPSYRASWMTHMLAGALGGSMVVAAGYTWYHFSTAKKLVDASKNLSTYIRLALPAQKDSTMPPPNAALAYLRSVAKGCVGIVPGSGFLVDQLFDKVDKVYETHQETASAIILQAYSEVVALEKTGDKWQTYTRVAQILNRMTSEILALGYKAGGDLLGPVWEKIPDTGLRTQFESSVEQLTKLARGQGESSRQYAIETQLLVKDLILKNASKEGLEAALKLVKNRVEELKQRRPDEEKK
ncbi:hypothetical protein C8J56DRAFT_927460 [Mycena floridula]|nr:hypothetical protein C8J56DRAFT_927460 [Mycena floridula]